MDTSRNFNLQTSMWVVTGFLMLQSMTVTAQSLWQNKTVEANDYPVAVVYPKYAVEVPSRNHVHILTVMFPKGGATFCDPPQMPQPASISNPLLSRIGNAFTLIHAYEPDGLSGSNCYSTKSIQLGKLPAGKYEVDIVPTGGPYRPEDLILPPFLNTKLTFAVLSLFQARQGVIEIPAEGSVQSGVGIISGWSCLAEIVEISIDGGARIKVPSESPRADVEAVCSHPNAGFGLLTNFNTLAEGDHTLQLYAKGIALGGLRKFTVVKPKGEFATGLRKETTAADFPDTGKTTTLDWRESEQRFGIKSVK